MSKIKTRDSTPGIKTIDRANVIGERMRKGLIRTKEKTMDLIDDGQVTADEYAADQVQSGVEEVIADTGHSVVTAPKHVYDHIHGKRASRTVNESAYENASPGNPPTPSPMQDRAPHKSGREAEPFRSEDISQNNIVEQGRTLAKTDAERRSALQKAPESPVVGDSVIKPNIIGSDTVTTSGVPTGIQPAYSRKDTHAFSPVPHTSELADFSQFRETPSIPKAATSSSQQSTIRGGMIKSSLQTREAKLSKNVEKRSIKVSNHTVKASRREIKQSERAIHNAQRSAKAALSAAKNTHRSAQAVRIAAQKAEAAARKAAIAIVKTVKAIIAGIKNLVAAIAAGGWTAVIAVVLICLIGCIIASPFGIFFAGENRDAGCVSVAAAVAQIQYNFNEHLEELQDGEYDSIVFEGSLSDWPELISVFAVKVADTDSADAMDVATLDAKRVQKLKDVFWDANAISAYEETIEHEDSDPEDDEDDSWVESILHIEVSTKTAAELMEQYSFSDKQKQLYTELMEERDTLESLIGETVFMDAETQTIIRNLPDDLSPERRAVVKTACSLVGKVNYFWGGKSLMIGWDSRWGSIRKVTSEGSPTTGTYRPYGLDCSGFVDWVFYNASNGKYYLSHGGGATRQHGYCTPTTWDQAEIGDLVFYPEDSHVGIVAGFDENGESLIIHCASGYNNVVITGKSGFEMVGRPRYYA